MNKYKLNMRNILRFMQPRPCAVFFVAVVFIFLKNASIWEEKGGIEIKARQIKILCELCIDNYQTLRNKNSEHKENDSHQQKDVNNEERKKKKKSKKYQDGKIDDFSNTNDVTFDNTLYDMEVVPVLRNKNHQRVLSNEQIKEKIDSLGEVVSVQDMHKIFDLIHDNEKKKFFNMKEDIHEYSEKLSQYYDIPENIKKKCWLKASYEMEETLINKENFFFKNFYVFANIGERKRSSLLDAIYGYQKKWKEVRYTVDETWREYIYQKFIDFDNKRKRKLRSQ
ncbi:hypothetical protein PFAG_02674 [Plasmodium falciparum Santa Lucia]|uniref:Plasmodium RESA N-terminal domain-containing protein n=2 Tax=Plasmodium falciparum TaxID=5833 RepID=A0A024V6W1_PLAFA|nr:hypothetical protein PFFVO_02695 [Plasmodium falciparum Vietnam Oak-Knoll (FVO)]EUT85966.1 hypothetical protein PFAG_02674 [Plasmodium falciparum Santa Lucia]